MNANRILATLVLTSLGTLGVQAHASDEFAGALIGAGTGALIGHSLNRQDGAAVGGILGAMVGVAIANDRDDRRTVIVRQPPRVVYAPPPVVVYERPRYVQPVVVEARPFPPAWGVYRHERWEERHEWRDDRRDSRKERHGRDFDDHHGHGW